MTHLIHIVGAQGVGKTSLAVDIIAAYAKRGKTALSMVEAGLHIERPPANLDVLRTQPIRLPGEKQGRHYDAVIVEHQVEPIPHGHTQPGDLVIRMERVPAC